MPKFQDSSRYVEFRESCTIVWSNPSPDNTFQTQLSVTKSIITTDQVTVNSAYEPSGPDQARVYPGLFNIKRLGVLLLPLGWDASPY